MKEVKIGIFDSGIGGLNLLHDCVKSMGGVTFYYYGDHLNAPYGNKSQRELYELSKSAFSLFEKLGVDAVVIACNTVTTECVKMLRETFSFKIFGLEPALRPAAAKCKKILVLATFATLSSPSFLKLKSQFPDNEIICFPPRSLAGEIEEKILFEPLDYFMKFLPFHAVDGVVIGCTHYLYLREKIEKFYFAPVFDGNSGIIIHLIKYLTNKTGIETLSDEKCKNNIIFVGNSKRYNNNVYKHMFV